jgi:hypothetical protein
MNSGKSGNRVFGSKGKEPSSDKIDSIANSIQKSSDTKSESKATRTATPAKKFQVHIYPDEAVYNALQKMKAEDGVSISFYINKLLKEKFNI